MTPLPKSTPRTAYRLTAPCPRGTCPELARAAAPHPVAGFPRPRRFCGVAFALACALSAPAAAQSYDFEFYGKLYPEVLRYEVSGATPADAEVSDLAVRPTGGADYSGSELESSNSRIGVRGGLDLGDTGLRAIVQLETTVPIDSGTKDGDFWDRDTFVGLETPFGTVKVGVLDTVYKTMAEGASFLGVSSGNFVSISNIIARQGFGRSSASSFHLRGKNTIYYESPVRAGFQGLAQYSVGEKTEPNAPEPWLASYGVQYNRGGFYAGIAHEIHRDFYGGTLSMPTSELRDTGGKTSRDESVRLTLRQNFGGGTRVDVNLARTRFRERGGADGHFRSYEHDTWSIGLQHKLGRWTLAAQHGSAGAGRCRLVGLDDCSTDGLEGRMDSVGASYSLAKQVALFGLFTDLRNGRSATYNNLGEAPRGGTGADIRQAALGLSVGF